ncbi:MAG: ribonuclease III [Gammaproteobacteria bacterium]|nr:MAG: ribonuclease III [Gammaproteobacteria bacterium]
MKRFPDILPECMTADHPLMAEALTHRSASRHNNERLEFLGDGILNMVIAEALYRQLPDANEGVLSRLRAGLVNRDMLASLAQEMGLGEWIRLGQGEMKSGGHRRESILADTVEAIIAAIHQGCGFETARQFVLDLYREHLEHLPSLDEMKDPKSRLQEYLQGRGMPPPSYQLLHTTGKAHDQEFHVRASIPDLGLKAEGQGSSRKKAEQQAASLLLSRIEQAANG